ncbi:hypothetical protein [Arenibaculum pallidiluteum]|uniref:hypothetical protein n=1 Tax=Arenibaculum pallidiluteum TaxID=2812559 RepID=UPI001A97B992|nr:hypothetical protein [Arenibaculum pallidiluteum]
MESKDETAIEFTERLKVDFSNKLDKVINSTLKARPQDRGDYLELTGWFTPLEAKIDGTRRAYGEFCEHKGGKFTNLNLGDFSKTWFCVTEAGNVIFSVALSERKDSRTRVVDYTVREPKPRTFSSALNANYEEAEKTAPIPVAEALGRYEKGLTNAGFKAYGTSCPARLSHVLNTTLGIHATTNGKPVPKLHRQWAKHDGCSVGGWFELTERPLSEGVCLKVTAYLQTDPVTDRSMTACRAGGSPNDWTIVSQR